MPEKLDLFDIMNVIKTCIVLHKSPPTVREIESAFVEFFGEPVPCDQFGYPNLKSLLHSMPDVYFEQCNNGDERFIVYDQKIEHIKNLLKTDKKRKNRNSNSPFNEANKKLKTSSYSMKEELNESSNLVVEFENFEFILPLFFKHQAMGDDFFVDIAENKFGCYIPSNGPIQIGKCKLNQTISELTQDIKSSIVLLDHVVIMIGHSDLMKGEPLSKMKRDLRDLVKTLVKRNIKVTLLTIIKSANKYYSQHLNRKLKMFNKIIKDYSKDPCYRCDVIDMYQLFSSKHKRNDQPSYEDRYQVFSPTGRNLFYNKLKDLQKLL